MAKRIAAAKHASHSSGLVNIGFGCILGVEVGEVEGRGGVLVDISPMLVADAVGKDVGSGAGENGKMRLLCPIASCPGTMGDRR